MSNLLIKMIQALIATILFKNFANAQQQV
jgi:hypothetical protein